MGIHTIPSTCSKCRSADTRSAPVSIVWAAIQASFVWQTGRVAESVLGEELQPCSYDPLTGWSRDGCCNTDGDDFGVHTVCAVLTEEFLEFSASVGNDLSAPNPEIGFDGLQPGDRWCLCASRWAEALEAGMAPPVILEATHARTFEWVSRSDLEAHRFEPAEGTS